jgi:hypothetical protein
MGRIGSVSSWRARVTFSARLPLASQARSTPLSG